MLICPQCEFENPQDHKYCQSCGISLTQKVCCECKANIPIEAKTCSFCGAVNHTILWAVISQTHTALEVAQQVESESDDFPEKEIKNLSDLFTENKNKAVPALKIQAGSQNSSNRYVIEEQKGSDLPADWQNAENSFMQGKVIDKYPLQKSYLATLQKQQMDLFAELSQDPDNSYLSVTQYWNLVGIPTHALPYLILEKYTPTIPKLYDAWQQSDRGVILLPDRSEWKLMTELWSQQQLPLLQIIWFLDEMAKLWEPLHQIGCAQSLLIDRNLRIDEDQAFCFQQLYIDRIDDPPTLKDLAVTWQLCFAESNLDHIDNLNQLLDRVISGEITLIEDLRLELHNLGLGEDEIESFDIHSNYSEVNIPQSQPNNNIEPVREAENIEQQPFFDESEDDMMYSSEFEEQATAMIPMQLRSVIDASCTNIGSQRDHNEDFFGIRTKIEKQENNADSNLSVRGLYIVCDGMGGHAAGEVASAMAVENLQKYFSSSWQQDLPEHKTIEQGILQANEALYQTNIDNSRSGSGRMGTTLVMALLQDTQLAIAHVGDSRIYRISRRQGLEQLTLDHEVGQREINRGVEPDIAYGRPDAYQLTQALGPRENNYVRPDIQFMEITEDCLLLLCSDGLCDNDLLEKNWQERLEPLISSSSNLQKGLFDLVDFANEYNGHDNITAVLVRVKLKPDF
ncbi:MAG: serine/threonine phosphatase [Cyanobacteria bacterium P01_G01_bin.19]